MNRFMIFVFTCLAFLPSMTSAQNLIFLQNRHALVQAADSSMMYRNTGLEVLQAGDYKFKVFHINSEDFSVVELTLIRRSVVWSHVSLWPGATYIDNSFGDKMFGPNLALEAWGGILSIPLARYLWSVKGDGKSQWAGIVDLRVGDLIASAQSFNGNWEAQIGWAFPKAFKMDPDLRLLHNKNGWGIESRWSVGLQLQ